MSASDDGAAEAASCAAAQDTAAPAAVGLTRLFLAFFRLGCTSFGGGSAGWLYRDMVQKRRWVDDNSFLAAMGLGQVFPGANGVKLSVLIGLHLRGTAGAGAAVLGLLSGPFAIVLAVGAAYAGIGTRPVLEAALDGVTATVIGLTFATGLSSAWRGSRGPAALALVGLTVLAVGVLRWPMVPVVLVLAPVSIGIAFARQRVV